MIRNLLCGIAAGLLLIGAAARADDNDAADQKVAADKAKVQQDTATVQADRAKVRADHEQVVDDRSSGARIGTSCAGTGARIAGKTARTATEQLLEPSDGARGRSPRAPSHLDQRPGSANT